MRKSIILGIIISALLIVSSCKKNTASTASGSHNLIFKFVFDSTQVRLNNFGQPDSTVPPNHGAVSPHMNVMSGHYIEMAATDTTQLGYGTVLYMTPTTNAGGANTNAIDFSKEVLTSNGGTFFSVPLDSVKPGTYKWLRVSLAYQNYTVPLYEDTSFTYGGVPVTINQTFPCTIASFVGVNTYITSYIIQSTTEYVNANKLQGYWGFEAKDTFFGNYLGYPYTYPFDYLATGQAPADSTTVVNPLFATSKIPAGSCVATGQFATSNSTTLLTIPPKGTSTGDIVITVSLSVNHSFEWQEVGTPDGLWQPNKGENILNMGIRGLIPYVGQ